MRVDVVFPSGETHSTMLRDGEVTEVKAGAGTVLRVRRVTRHHVRCELWPEEEERPPVRLGVAVAPPELVDPLDE